MFIVQVVLAQAGCSARCVTLRLSHEVMSGPPAFAALLSVILAVFCPSSSHHHLRLYIFLLAGPAAVPATRRTHAALPQLLACQFRAAALLA